MRAIAIILTLTAAAGAHEVTVAWDSPADSAGIVGYRLKWGAEPGAWTESADAGLSTEYTLTLPEGADVYLVAVSYNAAGLESLPSNELAIPLTKPPPPEGLRIELSFSSAGDTATVTFPAEGGELTLEASDDLDAWRRVVTLDAATPLLARLEFPAAARAFYRLAAPEGSEGD